MLGLPAMLGISAGTNVMNTAANWYWQQKITIIKNISKISFSAVRIQRFSVGWPISKPLVFLLFSLLVPVLNPAQ